MEHRYRFRHEILSHVWNEFVTNHPGGWWWHRTEWLDYCSAYGHCTPEQDRSFAICDEAERIIAICPALIGQPAVITGGGAPLGLPLFLESLCTARDIWMRLLQEAKAFGVGYGEYRSLPLGVSGSAASATTDAFRAASMYHQSAFTPILTRVLPLGSLERLWTHIRKSYKGEIRKQERVYQLQVIEGTDQRYPFWIEAMRVLHCEAAGRETRPRETWQLMGQWAEQSYACIATACDHASGDLVGYAFVIRYKHWAYYASGAGRVQHALQWAIIQHLIQQGVSYYELGWQPQSTDQKEQSIAFFKRGFGGLDFPFTIYRPRFDAVC